jgi:diguanylate cyclase (GGDEF)-like protein
LAIDDSAEIHDLIDVRLAPEGVAVLHATDGAEGLALAASLQPDLILLDVVLPGLSGFEICQQLKSDFATASIPVIFLSGASDSFNMVHGLDLGAVDYIAKPFDPAELRARVRAALRTKRYQDMLAQRAQIDALTGLWNRSSFDKRLKDEMAAFSRYGRTVSLAMIDLDGFKTLNDTYGHPFGDRVLQAVGESLQSMVRATDFACRYGGDEFAVIFTECSVEEATEAAERFAAGLNALRWEYDKSAVRLAASVGVTCTDHFSAADVVHCSEFVSSADSALYRAKRAGGNRVVISGKPAGDDGEQAVQPQPALASTRSD